MGSVWNDDVKVSRLCIDEIKLLGFQDGLLFGLGHHSCIVRSLVLVGNTSSVAWL